MNCWLAVLFLATLLCVPELIDGCKKNECRAEVAVAKNSIRSEAPKLTLTQDNFYDLNNKMLPNTKLVRSKRSPRPRPRNLGRRRPPPPPFLSSRLPPIARRRFPKRPGKVRFPGKPPILGPHPRPGSKYGPPVGYFVMNINNEIVHKSKDLGDIPPQYLDKIIPPNFINDSPHKIYAVEHDEGPPLGLGESKEVSFTPTNSYGVPVKPHHLDPDQYYPYPSAPAIESNNVPQSSESRPHAHNQNVNSYNRGQSETQYNQDQLPPLVYHPPYKKKNKKKKKKQQQHQQQIHQEFALQADSGKNTYPVSSYDAPLSYIPGSGGSPSSSSVEKESVRYPAHPQKVRPAYNVGQSFVESYSRESNEQEPPLLPAVYNQNDFKTVNKSNNKKKVVYQVNTSYEDFDDEDHGLALEYPPFEEESTEVPSFNFGARYQRKKKPPKFDFIDSYEDSSISQEVYHTTPFTVKRPFKKVQAPTVTTTTRTYKVRSTTKDPLFDILDTEDLRTAFQSGRTRYKLAAANKKKEQPNFVLLSSKNPTPSTKTPFLIHSGESGEVYNFPKSKGSSSSFDRPPSSLETDYESYEIAERDFGLRKRDFNHKRKAASSRIDASVEKMVFADAKRKEEFVRPTTIKPYARFNPDVHFTKTFSSKIEQPREASIWNGQAIPGNHKITKRGGSL